MTRKAIIFLFLVVAVFLVWRFVLSDRSLPKTASVSRRDLEVAVDVSGKVKADRFANLSFAVTGQLEKIAGSGAVFQEGEIAARLKTDELYAALQQAYAALNKARSTLSYYLEVQGETEKTYLGGDDVSRAKRNEARTNAEAASASVQYYQFALDQAQTIYQKAFLTAPFDGIVGQVLMNVGETAAVGAPVLSFFDSTSFYFDVEVDEVDIGSLVIGQKGTIKLDGYPGREFAGMVSRIDPAPHTAGAGGTVYGVRLDFIDDRPADLRLGFNGEAHLVKEVKKDVLTLPADAIIFEGGQSYARFLEKGKKVKRLITVGELVGDDYEVSAGAGAGEEAVLVVP